MTPKLEPIVVRLKPDVHRALVSYARKHKLSQSEVLRAAIVRVIDGSMSKGDFGSRTVRVSFRDPDRLTYRLQRQAERLGASGAELLEASLKEILDGE